jgi:hypothetical protein
MKNSGKEHYIASFFEECLNSCKKTFTYDQAKVPAVLNPRRASATSPTASPTKSSLKRKSKTTKRRRVL